MADLRIDTAIHYRSVIYLVLIFIGVLIFIVAGIIPGYEKMRDLDYKISRINAQAEEEKHLVPFYSSLKEKAQGKDSRLLPFPVRESIPKDKTDMIFTTLNEMAHKNSMDVISIVPNINSLTGKIKYLPVNIILRGDFFNFRKFLSSAGGMPYLERIEEIEIQQIPEGKEYRMRLWLAVS